MVFQTLLTEVVVLVAVVMTKVGGVESRVDTNLGKESGREGRRERDRN